MPKTQAMTTICCEVASTGLKPLSANQAFTGKKVKTAAYRKYENHLLRTLPDRIIPAGLLVLRALVRYSSKLSDLDNALKPFIDVLQKRYGFNDNKIYKLEIFKEIVAKGKEEIVFELVPYTGESPTWHSNAPEPSTS